MADNRLNKTGLAYFYNRLKTIFATKASVETLESTVQDLVTEGGEPNTINTVKVNGTALTPDANKAVDVTAAQLAVDNGTAHFTQGHQTVSFVPNSFNGTMMVHVDDNGDHSECNLATTDYVNDNGGKIDKIKVNGTEQTITNKEVDITTPTVVYNAVGGYDDVNIYGDAVNSQNHLNVRYKQDDEYVSIFAGGLQGDGDGIRLAPMSSVPTSVSDLTNDSGYQTSSDVSTAITNAIAGITQFDFSVVTELPTSGTKGVIYLVSNSGSGNNIYDEYIWVTNGGTSAFEKIGTTEVDLSGYWNETNLTAITTAEIDAIIDGE